MESETLLKKISRRDAFMNWLRFFNKRATNRLTLRFAGKRVFGVVHHRGRKSGVAYQTPVVAVTAEENFIIPLTYGEGTDWCQNVLASGGCQLELGGKFYSLEAPELIGHDQAITAFPGWLQPLLKRVPAYLKLKRSGRDELPQDRSIRKILVIGAGVLGSLYAGKLYRAGYAVTLLGRGSRLEELQQRGLLLQEDGSERIERFAVAVTDHLGEQEAYDLVLVVVRKNQIQGVLSILKDHQHTPNILFLVNNAAGPDALVQALGKERVLLGFPGAGGQRQAGLVTYRLVSKGQPTTIGEVDGQMTPRLEQAAQVFRDAGLPVAKCANMDAWLKTHVALVSPIANALYLAGGDNTRLADTRDGLVLMVRAIKEGLGVLNELDIPITPSSYRMLAWIPEPLIIAVLEKRMKSPQVELVLTRHANAARDEMTTLAEEFQVLALLSGKATPALDALYTYTDPTTPQMPIGQAQLAVNWKPTLIAAGVLLAALGVLRVLGGWWVRGKKHRRIRK